MRIKKETSAEKEPSVDDPVLELPKENLEDKTVTLQDSPDLITQDVLSSQDKVSSSSDESFVRVSSVSTSASLSTTVKEKAKVTRKPNPSSQKQRFAISSQLFSSKSKDSDQRDRRKFNQRKEEVVLPPGFASDGLKNDVPDWVKDLDASRAKLGPTGRHISDIKPVKKNVSEEVVADVKPRPKRPAFQKDVHVRAKTTSIFDTSSDKKTSTRSKAPSFSSSFESQSYSSFEKDGGSSQKPQRSWGSSEFGFDSQAASSKDRPSYGGRHSKRRGSDSYKSGKGFGDSGFSSGQHFSRTKDSEANKSNILKVPSHLKINLPMSARDLAASMKIRVDQMIAKMFMHRIVLTPSDVIDQVDMAVLIGEEFGCKIEASNVSEDMSKASKFSLKDELENTDKSLLSNRPPVVAFMGHVDHGKTSLIDAIRSSSRVLGEAGSITQHIGAFKCIHNGSSITILDTPGHQAFEQMRSMGAKVTDIAIIVIAGDEGVKPQTEESIKVAKESGCSIVIALSKSDKAGFDSEKVYRRLSEMDLVPEAWGGPIVTVSCSAVQKSGINDLLDILILQSEVLELKADKSSRARGAVIESCVDKGLGPCATVIIQNGTLFVGDSFVIGSEWGRVRKIKDENNKDLRKAEPSDAVVVYGMCAPPPVGEEFIVVKDEQSARSIIDAREKVSTRQLKSVPSSIEDIMGKAGSCKQKFRVIIRGDVHGSVQALGNALKNLPSDRVEIEILSQTVGPITESVVNLALASKAVIIGFQTYVDTRAQVIAKNNGIGIHIYDVVYHAVDAVMDMMRASLSKVVSEKASGVAEIRAIFKSSKFGVIAGCMVIEGILKRQQVVRVMRNGELVHTGKIISMRSGQDDVKESSKGFECGIVMDNFGKYEIGDRLHSHDVVYLSQGLTECEDEKNV